MLLRDARATDVNFIVDLIEQDTKSGHYLEHPVEEQARTSHLYMVRSAILDGWIQYSFAPNMRARVYVPELASERAGFVLVREPPFMTFAGHPYPLVELHMLSLAPHLRGQGHGSQLIDLIINKYEERQPLFGRCLSASDIMVGMLRRRKFREVWRHDGVHWFLRSGPLIAQRFAKEIRDMAGP